MGEGKLLIVVDADIRSTLADDLSAFGYSVIVAANGQAALSKMTQGPRLIVIDADFKAIDAISTCQGIRRNTTIPIIFIGTSAEASTRIACLNAGADNYLTKPVTPPELAAFVEAALRRQASFHSSSANIISIKDLTLDVNAHELKRNDKLIHLTSTEFKLFKTLAVNCGNVVTRDNLLYEVWEIDSAGFYSRTIDVHVGRMRRKIGDDPTNPKYILTVNGVGYKISAG